jgi:hypothetical protein
MILSPYVAAAAFSLKGARTSAFRSLDHAVEEGPPQSPHFEPLTRELIAALKARGKH